MTDESAGDPKPGEWDPIVRHYERCFAAYGACPRGVDWPNGLDLGTRFGVMLQILADAGEQPVLLDLGCGPGLLLDYLAATNQINGLQYRGIDLSPTMIKAARERWPHHLFECRDVMTNRLTDQSVDVVIMNGVLTERVSLSSESMIELAQALLTAAFKVARVGIAFNVMNAHADWRRDDLFYWNFDAVAAFLKQQVSRHYEFRADYGLYEYTCFVRREPRRPLYPTSKGWWTR